MIVPHDFQIFDLLRHMGDYAESRGALLRQRWPTADDAIAYLFANGVEVYFDSAADDAIAPYFIPSRGEYLGEAQIRWIADELETI